MRNVLICAAVLAVSACSVSQEAARPALEVSPGAIEAHIRFLADDQMEGREAGTRGYALATNYVEAQFRLIGLEPGGLEGFRAAVPLQTLTPLPEHAEMRVDGVAMAPGDDFIVGGPSCS